MNITTHEKAVLKALVEQELREVKEQGKKFKVVNSPVLSSIYRMTETDIPFLKTEVLYIEFLEELFKKL